MPLAAQSPAGPAGGMQSRTRRYECRHHSRPTVVAGVNIRQGHLGPCRLLCHALCSDTLVACDRMTGDGCASGSGTGPGWAWTRAVPACRGACSAIHPVCGSAGIVRGRCARTLQADDGLAAQGAAAELVQPLPGGVRVGGGTDTRGDRAVREHRRDCGQPFGRDQGIGPGGMVTRSDLPLREPAFAGREDGRDQASAGPDDPGVAADRVRAADQVQDGTGAAGVSGAQRIDHVRGLAVVPLPGAEPRRRRRGRRRSRARRGSAPSAPRSRRPRRPRPSPRRARRVATQQLRRAPLRGHRQILGARGRP
jgi:hypothetical protein